MQPNVAGAAKRRLQCHDAESLRALADEPRLPSSFIGSSSTGSGSTGSGSGVGSSIGGCVGWTYTVERSPSGVPKPGWIASAPSAHCTFSYRLSNASAAVHRVGVGYLKSYEHMGQV